MLQRGPLPSPGRRISFSLESIINVVMSLDGGKKKKKKKKNFTKPKRIPHKHKNRPKALLEYFTVDNSGKISKVKIECEKCPAGNSYSFNYKGTYMADHHDRHTCGQCGNMFYKLTKDGKRVAPLLHKKPKIVEKAAVEAGKKKH